MRPPEIADSTEAERRKYISICCIEMRRIVLLIEGIFIKM